MCAHKREVKRNGVFARVCVCFFFSGTYCFLCPSRFFSVGVCLSRYTRASGNVRKRACTLYTYRERVDAYVRENATVRRDGCAAGRIRVSLRGVVGPPQWNRRHIDHAGGRLSQRPRVGATFCVVYSRCYTHARAHTLAYLVFHWSALSLSLTLPPPIPATPLPSTVLFLPLMRA